LVLMKLCKYPKKYHIIFLWAKTLIGLLQSPTNQRKEASEIYCGNGAKGKYKNDMRILGLDVGDILIGVAVSDPTSTIAQGLDSIKRKNLKIDVQKIRSLTEEYKVKSIVVGLPKMLSGEIGIQAQKVLDFADKFREVVGVPVVFWDERFTTVAANKTLIKANVRRKKRKQVADKMAAVLILQGYLDNQRQSSYTESDSTDEYNQT